MNALLPRILKSAYRKEPISSFVIIVGAVDTAIGGADASGSLFAFGLGTIVVAIAFRWWQIQRHQQPEPEAAPEYYLPSSSSQSPLPMLTPYRKRPPH